MSLLTKVSPPLWARVHYFSWGHGGHPIQGQGEHPLTLQLRGDGSLLVLVLLQSVGVGVGVGVGVVVAAVSYTNHTLTTKRIV